MRDRKSTDDISVIVLFFHVSKHNQAHDAFVGDLDPFFAQSDDEPLSEEPEEPEGQRITRSHSEVSMTLYLSRQSQRDSIARTSLRDMFSRTPDELHEMRLPSVGRELSSMEMKPALL